jgi:hypothetical protein
VLVGRGLQIKVTLAVKVIHQPVRLTMLVAVVAVHPLWVLMRALELAVTVALA